MGYIGAGLTRFNTADELTVTGDAEFNGNASFGDNDSAIFGAGNDLTINHDGNNSFITDSGTGSLYIQGTSGVFIRSADGGETLAAFTDDGAATLYYDNAAKLATTATGVDVTGTVTADGLTVDTSDQVIINHSGDGGGIRIDSTNNTNTGSLRFGDAADNYIGAVEYNHSTDALSFYANNATRMTISSAGNVGIGGTPSYPLHVQSGSTSSVVRITNTGSTDANVNSILQLATATNVAQLLLNELNNYSQFSHSGDLTFHYDDVDNHVFRTKAGSEKMRIDSSNLLVGVSSTANAGKIKIETNDEWTIGSDVNNGTTSKGHIAFYNPNGLVGYISTSGTSTAYNTSSDYRLKENVTADWDATTRLKQLNPVRFNFIADADTTVDGFLAHEVQDIVPEAIVGEKDAMRDEEYEVSAATGDIYTPAVAATYDEDGVELTAAVDEVIHSADVEQPEELAEGQQWRETTAAVMGTRSVPDFQGIDQSKLVPLLVKTILELEARIAALETA